jgi:hypothetical protein
MMTGGLVRFRDMDQFRAAAEGRDSIKQQTSASVQEAAVDSVKIQTAASAPEDASPSETVPPILPVTNEVTPSAPNETRGADVKATPKVIGSKRTNKKSNPAMPAYIKPATSVSIVFGFIALLLAVILPPR